MNKRLRILVGLIVAMLLPLSLYFLAKNLSKDRVIIPKYYGANITEANDTTYLKLSDIQLNNQLDKAIRINKDLEGKVLIVNFMSNNANQLQDSLIKNERVMQQSFLKKIPEKFYFITFSTHPQLNTVAALRKYADQFHIDHDRWAFLSGDSVAIANYQQTISTAIQQPITARTLILIDEYRHIRGYYNGLDPISLKQCADDAVFITLEKHKIK